MAMTPEMKKALRFSSFLFLFEIFLILCYAFSADYADSVQATGTAHDISRWSVVYKMYSDVHVMIFVGFGFLMTFLHAYSWSAVGLNFLLSALAVQWAMLMVPFWHMAYHHHWEVIHLDIYSLINGDFAAGALMISFGAVLGKVSSTQLLVMTVIEMIVYGINEMIITQRLKAIDMGGSMIIHTFGAYFGLAVSWAIGNPAEGKASPSFTKWSSTLAMVGTVFLWIYWPSFNAALAGQDGQQARVVINTLLSIASSCIAAFFCSRLMRPGKKFDFEDLQNATLAGGVAVGSSSDLVIRPWGAMVIGNVAGIISTAGFVYLSPLLYRKLKLHDTCGVHNLHGMPGLLGGIAGAISAATAGEFSYGMAIGDLFPARLPQPAGEGWSAATQGAHQFAALLVAIALGIGGGLLAGYLMKLPCFDPLTSHHYQDVSEWSVHLDGELNGKTEHDVEHEAGGHAHAKDASTPSSSSSPASAAGVELTAVVTGEGEESTLRHLTPSQLTALVTAEVNKALRHRSKAGEEETPAPAAGVTLRTPVEASA